MSKENKGGYQILDLSFVENLTIGENYINVEFIDDKYSSFKDDNFRNLYKTVSNPNNKKRFVITGITLDGIEYKDILVRNVSYGYQLDADGNISTTANPYITLILYNGTSIIIGYSYIGYPTILIEITGGIA